MRRRPVWLFQVCTSAGMSTLVISAACVVAAWELSLVASRGSQLAVYGQSPQWHLDRTCSGETCSNQTTRSAFLSRSERNGVQLKTEIGLRMLLACHLVAKPIPVRTHSHRSPALVLCPSCRTQEQGPLPASPWLPRRTFVVSWTTRRARHSWAGCVAVASCPSGEAWTAPGSSPCPWIGAIHWCWSVAASHWLPIL